MSRIPLQIVLGACLVCASACSSSEPGTPDAAVPDSAVDATVDTSPPSPDAAPRVATSPLTTIAPTDDLSDLAPLAPIIAQAEVVGIGESVHTAGGQLQMRTRLIHYLVTHHKFRLVGFESERTPVALSMEPYLQSDCTGSAEDASAINPIWWEESTPALVRWLCKWNVSHPDDQVHAMGFDIHQPWYDYPTIKSYLESVAPAEAAKLDSGAYLCLGAKYASMEAFFADPNNTAYYEGDGVHVVPQADHDACQAGTTAILDYLDVHRAQLVATSERNFELARIAVVGLQAFDTSIFQFSRGVIDNEPRDRAMADVFRTIRHLDFPGLRAILWAHNGHIIQHSDEVATGQWTGVKGMGTLVAADLKGSYAAIGQVSAITHLNWSTGPETITAPLGSVEQILYQYINQPLLLVDMLAATTGGTPLFAPDTEYRVAIDVFFPKVAPARHFDALIYQSDCPGPKYFKAPPWFKGY